MVVKSGEIRPNPEVSGTDNGTYFVYFVQAVMDDGPIKIGRALDPHKRLAELGTMSPAPLEPLGLITPGGLTEAEVHQRFADLRLHGEWFRPAGILYEFIRDCTVRWPKPKPKRRRNELKVIRQLGPLRLVDGGVRREYRYKVFYWDQGKWKAAKEYTSDR